MLNTVKVSLKDSLIYGLGNIAVKIIGFILIPLYTDPRYFSIDDFGIIAVLDISGLVLISLMASALPQSFMRWYWDREHIKDQKQIFFMTLSVQVLVSMLFLVLILPFTAQISTIIFGTDKWSFSQTSCSFDSVSGNKQYHKYADEGPVKISVVYGCQYFKAAHCTVAYSLFYCP